MASDPPPAKPVTTRMMKSIDKVSADKDKLAEMRKHGEPEETPYASCSCILQTQASKCSDSIVAQESVWFDYGAPGTRAKRQYTRASFEYTVKLMFQKTTAAEIWNATTFIMYCKMFLEAMIIFSQENKTACLGQYAQSAL